MWYDGGSNSGSHPRRLALLGRVFGMSPAPPSNCRVLELGCALGTNLIHMAASEPNSEFVGIDLFESQIIEARRRAAQLGLKNIRFEAADIMDFGTGEKPYDYIIAHGVFSWVPKPVKEGIFALCNNLLTPHGIAYLTYNVLPGWYMRLPVRDLMVMAAGEGQAEDRVRRAAGILDFVLKASESAEDHDNRDNSFETLIRRERTILDAMPAAYVAHEHLERTNEPIYFKDFVDMAAGHGLQYLADSAIALMFPTEMAEDVRVQLDRMTTSQVALEQLMDFIRGRQFRQTLLCRSDVDLERNLDGLRLDGMYLSLYGRPTRADNETEEPASPVKQAESLIRQERTARVRLADDDIGRLLKRLVEVDPLQVPFEDAIPPDADAERRREIERRVVAMFLSGMVQLDVERVPATTKISDRPKVRPAAIVTRGRNEVTNLFHKSVALSPLASVMIELLDGTRDHDAIREGLRAGIDLLDEDGAFSKLRDPAILEEAFEAALEEIAAAALLEPD